jgi:WD40 repeat protein
MTASEKQASANILALLQGKPAASRVFAKPAAPRALSREDALSLRIHASSALVPNAAVISPVVRVHLVHPELGSPVRPSGEATTPMQTAPFDMTRRRAATFAAEWQETLEVEEALGDVLGARAVALFEVLQLPPSFTYYEERSASFPGGQPMRVAWGFLKLLRGSDGKPNMGRLKVQLYRWDDRVGVLGLGGAAAVDAAADAPEVFKEWKRALQVAPSLRRLYPAHLDVTVASSPRTDVVAALLSAPRPGADAPPLAIAAPPAAQKSLSGVGDDEDAPRPTRRERIDRERAMGGGWRNAETRLARAPVSDREEIAEKLGRLPHETLCYGVNPKAAAAAREAQVAAEAEAATPGLSGSTSWKAMSAKRAVVKLPHARAKQEECLIPNADARTQPHLPDTASEATLASFDPMGRRLAVVCREGAMYAVRVFDASTGALIAAFPGHASTVYDVQWAPERGEAGGAHAAADALGTVDFAAPATRVLTASADGAARAWRVPAMGEDPVSEAAANAFDIVAQHACGCYSAAWHPTAPGVLATGARDGGVRLWATDDAAGAGGVRNARVIAAVASAPGVAATAMAFDRTGLRLWVGFADGVVREHRVDVTPRDGSANEGPSVKSLRECKDLLGEPITCLRAGPTDRRLFARTVADRVAAVDVGFFAATHTFECDGGARGTMRAIRAGGPGGALRSAEGAFAGSAASGAASAGRPLARLALSPDGRWMVAGGPDGSARLFDVDVGGIGVMLPAASVPPGVRVNDVAWSPAAHCVAVCAAGGARPLRLAAHSETAQRGGSAAAAEASAGAERLGGQPRRQAAPEDGGGDETAARGCRVRQRRERRAKEPIARETHPRGCARDARQGANRKRRATTRRAGGGSTREESGNGFCRGRGGRNGRGGSALLSGCGAAVLCCGGVRRRSARGGLRAGGANPVCAAAGTRRVVERKRAGGGGAGSRAAPAPAPAFPSFDPYGGSVGVGLGASTVGAGAQPRAPAGPY